MPRASRVFVELALPTALLSALLWAPLIFEILVDRACGPDEIPATPLLELRRFYDRGPWVLVPGLLLFVILAWRRAVPALAGRSLRRKLLVLGSAFALQAGLFFGMVMLNLELDPHWLFGIDVPTLRQDSPDGRRTAWAGRACFFGCNWNVYVREGGAWKMKRVLHQPTAENSSEHATLVWSADGREVTISAEP